MNAIERMMLDTASGGDGARTFRNIALEAASDLNRAIMAVHFVAVSNTFSAKPRLTCGQTSP